ncbi:OB-fold nucleic acid binding domain-containing protein [Cutibacterium avidum]|uniref:Nucleic acid binding OB-fold domain protein n=1 Tax=Cutibacterium avidum ATCC 25577 TaxID=997355 RepID=G4CZM8_9ACTN|nr:OB-fold nucleic acid binding domain-containing protein [Cutibacterium avidum]MBS6259358.1 OB-fold nucleic acid binding domain-containing protein [Propionibacterium sp.]EGY76947.1 nucleic acid binding OB-fold domain protein [Cutibacterium avidum ATCC 25577]MCO6661608.1 OB-fold nucleic acid binding domain-containing protein [Cutibacterium avidum]MCO6682670.1 OB-fold nucleic acid binding domain-containing protein [Cutibacterium avidum]MCO6684070.1 OB-fold nucleic acid binding domain-containing
MAEGTDARAPRESMLRRVLHRVTASNEDLVDDDLQRSSINAGVSTIAEARMRSRASLQGRIEVLTLNPRGTNRWLEAELRDGTGAVTLIWMGRRRIPGLRAGRRISVEGMITEADGRRVIYNPRYTVLPD